MAAGIPLPTRGDKPEEREDTARSGVPLVFRSEAQRALDEQLGREREWASRWAVWAAVRQASRAMRR